MKQTVAILSVALLVAPAASFAQSYYPSYSYPSYTYPSYTYPTYSYPTYYYGSYATPVVITGINNSPYYYQPNQPYYGGYGMQQQQQQQQYGGYYPNNYQTNQPPRWHGSSSNLAPQQGVPTGDYVWGQPICYYSNYGGRAFCGSDPRQPVYDPWTGTWY